MLPRAADVASAPDRLFLEIFFFLKLLKWDSRGRSTLIDKTSTTRFDLSAAKSIWSWKRCVIHSFFFFSLPGCFFFFFFPVTAYRTDGSQLLWQIPSRWGQSAWWAVWLGHGLLRPGDPSFQCFPFYFWPTANGRSGSEWAYTSSGSHGGGPLGNTRLSLPGCSFNSYEKTERRAFSFSCNRLKLLVLNLTGPSGLLFRKQW